MVSKHLLKSQNQKILGLHSNWSVIPEEELESDKLIEQSGQEIAITHSNPFKQSKTNIAFQNQNQYLIYI